MRFDAGKGGILAILLMGMPLATAHSQTARFERFTYRGQAVDPVKPGPGQFANPVLSGFYPDPSVTRVGDRYYLVNSSFAFFPGLPVFTSKDLVSWVQVGNAIDRPGQLDFAGRDLSEAVFAPDISFHAGTFFIVNTCVECGGNFVITARNPAGPWSDPTWLPFEGIDPSLYWEGDHAFIVNNRAPAEPPRYPGHRALWVQEYDWRAGRMVGSSTQLVNGGVDIATRPAWIEGPHLLRRHGWYYLLAAEGGTGDRHSEVVFRSRRLRGPFRPFPGPILTQRDLPAERPNPVTSTGHAELFETRGGKWWASFLGTRPYAGSFYNTGRETFLLPVSWRAGWPRILEPGRPVPLAVRRPDLAPDRLPALPTSGDFGYVDPFSGDRLAPQWIGIRTPRQPFHAVAGDGLELTSGAALGDRNGVPAFVGRRQQHAIATVSVTVRFHPVRDGARAGLAAVQSDRSNLFFGIERSGGSSRLAVYARNGSEHEELVATTPIDSTKAVTLTLHADRGRMDFGYRTEGESGPHALKTGVDATLLSTERAGGFVGTVIGPYTYTPG